MIISSIKNILLRIVSAALFAIAVLLIAGCGNTYGRDEFKELVMNKSETEVAKVIGEPDWVDDFEPKMWTYRSKTLDASNQKDAKTLVIFSRSSPTDSLKVVEVRFE